MALVDVTKPVVINATTAIVRENPDHLRRVCVVSLGQTTLKENEFKEMYKYDYVEYCLPYQEINTKLKSYFSQANTKSVVVLELGKQTGTPLADNYQALIGYCELQAGFDFDEYLTWIYQTSWADKTTEENADLLKQFYNYYSPNNQFDNTSYENWCTLNQVNKDEVASYIQYFTAVLPHDWESAYYTWLYANNTSFETAVKTKDKLDQYVTALDKVFDKQAYDIYLEEMGTKDTDYEEKIKALNNFVTNSQMPCYIIVLPDGMGADNTLQEKLFSLYNQLNTPLYFFCNFKNDDLTTYSTSVVYSQVKEQKCAALFCDNTIGQNLAALAAGMFASYKFDLSQTNPASPFNYKKLEGVKFKPLNSPLRQQMIQDSVNFVDQVSTSICLLNGRYGDTYAIEYRYQWDLTSFQVETDLKALILNGVNNPLYVIKYNQDGIDILKSRVKSTLNGMIEIGAVTEYAASMNPGDGSLIDVGDINCIGFREYIQSNPDDYENEIYGGISFYLRIGRYIRQVILNVTLG